VAVDSFSNSRLSFLGRELRIEDADDGVAGEVEEGDWASLQECSAEQ